ncbi:hypothetical protein [Stenotrophomonas sp. YIM B06876]|uniref:hypothetical protein n=1 Tax=Stenotrophomonas sp. YIM B06876 TaxID=3060211 RepID=UPI00273A5A13|nr:hypothetical protein [Stenotrophomonas sp. YIM B06876]
MPRLVQIAIVMLLLVAGAAAAAGPTRSQRTKLLQFQDGYAAAVRWSEFERALEFVDPEQQRTQPLSDLQRERYRQVQVSSYRESGGGVLPDGSVERRIEMGVINRNTQAERQVQVRERWRWDPAAKRWWQTQGLPDLWQGQ